MTQSDTERKRKIKTLLVGPIEAHSHSNPPSQLKEPKDRIVKGRVGKTMKAAVVSYAEQTGESEAVIVREALAEYFATRKIPIGKMQLGKAAITRWIHEEIPRPAEPGAKQSKAGPAGSVRSRRTKGKRAAQG